MSARHAVRTAGLGYLALLAVAPLGLVVWKAFEPGLASVANTLTSPDALHALQLSLLMVAVAVPVNTVFGVAAALGLVRHGGRWAGLLGAAVDLPLAVSPVVVGLALVLVYGRTGWLGDWLSAHGIEVIFSTPGMILATAFVSLPYVAREVEPVLREAGTDPEQAAATLGASPWQTFWLITLPQLRWALAYGVVLATARGLGEFGAVSVVSGRLSGQTQTLPLYVQDRFENFDLRGAYAIAVELAVLALITLVATRLVARRKFSY